jgi:hypothetical protein
MIALFRLDTATAAEASENDGAHLLRTDAG